MDRTETYIKQCERAEEIQKGHQFKVGDYCATFPLTVEAPIYNIGSITRITGELIFINENTMATKASRITWLPHQDRLQEMLSGVFRSNGFILLLALLNRLGSEGTCEHCIDTTFVDLSSMEQLWLAFVMKEKYNKIWDGGDWVKQPVEVANAD